MSVHDIRTKRAVGKTGRGEPHLFLLRMQALMENDILFYIAHGPCRHQEVRWLVDEIAMLDDLPVIYDRQLPADTVLIFEGDPEELGFTA